MGANKLLIDLDGTPVIARVVDSILASRATPVLVVTGHEGEALRTALRGRSVAFVTNPDYAQGLSASVRAGIAALPADADGVVVCLGDMPAVAANVIDALIDSFDPGSGAEIIAPSHDGRRGNPVLWGRRFFAELTTLTGDQGGKPVLLAHPRSCRFVAVESPGILLDLDTPEALRRYREATPRQDR